MFLKASESKSAARQTYGGASSPTMTLFSLSIKSHDLIMGLLAIAAGIFILIGR
jgi:uncharacterized membrane protein SpoIIM required for sporulation